MGHVKNVRCSKIRIGYDVNMNQVLSLTEDARVRIKEILSETEKDKIGVRIAVSEGGCAGYSYEMTYVENADPKDELIEHDDVKIFIDPAAIMFLLGSTMDFKSDKFKSGFVFMNPNETERCGCGESFSV
jgi:iron-sulfur cluster assembly protein